jgi:hypothetical protein
MWLLATWSNSPRRDALIAPLLMLFGMWLLERWFNSKGRAAKIEAKYRALRAAVKAELMPFMAELGFRKNRKSYAARPIDGPMGNTFSRERGAYVDEIQIEWASYERPEFFLFFWSDQTERMVQPDRSKLTPWKLKSKTYYACNMPRPRTRRRWWHRVFWGPAPTPGFGVGLTVDQAMANAKQKILEIDHHLKVGAVTPSMGLVGDVVVKRGDPSNARPDPSPLSGSS